MNYYLKFYFFRMALKRINSNHSSEEKHLQRIVREIKILKNLSKKEYDNYNIVTFFDFFSEGSSYFILTEFCQVILLKRCILILTFIN